MKKKNAKVSLREHFDLQVSSLEKATVLAAHSMEKRLEGMNEFREQLKDQASRFIVREEFTVVVENIQKDLRSLLHSKALIEGKASRNSVVIVLGLSLLGIIIAAFGFLLEIMKT